MQEGHVNPQALRYTRAQVIELLGLKPHIDLNRVIRSRPGFPEKLPGTIPPLWSKRAVDDWFNSDAGRSHLRQAPDEGRITVQTLDEIAVERDELNRRYGGRG